MRRKRIFFFNKQRKSKLRNIKTPYKGRTFDSALEAYIAEQLDKNKNHEDDRLRVVEVEYQPRIQLIPPPNRIDYIADFRVSYADGHTELLDAKGHETEVFKLKIKLLRHLDPVPGEPLYLVRGVYRYSKQTGRRKLVDFEKHLVKPAAEKQQQKEETKKEPKK